MTSENLKKSKEHTVPVNDQELDASVEMTFPASDPPSVGGTTKLKKNPTTKSNSSFNHPAKDKHQTTKHK